MLFAKDKVEFYNKLKRILAEKGFLLTPLVDINGGLQFQFQYKEDFGLIRILEGKNGIHLDLSEIKNKKVAEEIESSLVASDNIIHYYEDYNKSSQKEKKPEKNSSDILNSLISDPNEIIGIDDTGKNDYFGPLVIAAVHTNQTTKNKLEALDINNENILNNQIRLSRLADKIKEICPHSIIILSNKSFNEIYEKMKNINHMLAWGHARVIENVLNQSPCKYALSNQFNNASLINSSLMSKGKGITILHKPKPSENITVSAATILAQDAYLMNLQKINDTFNMTFPRGCSTNVLETARTFAGKHGKESLNYIAKLSFESSNFN